MKWPWTEVRRQRDRALIQLVEAQAKLREANEQRDGLRRELAVVQQALERVVDNALFAAGAAPVFHPEDARFRPRPVEQQLAEIQALQNEPVGMSPAEWRRRIEAADRERAQRDRKAELVADLRQVAGHARREKEAV